MTVFRPPMPRTLRGHLLRQARKRLPLDGRLPGGRALPPDAVYLMPTLRCDLACPYCFQRGLPRGDELTLDEWRGVIADLRPWRTSVVVMGGEVFQWRPALELLAAVKEAGLPLSVITNGTALPRVADALVELGLDGLIVSLDGPAAVHDRARGRPGAYERASEGLRRVLQRRGRSGRPTVQVFTAITAYTQQALATWVGEVCALGIDRLVLNALIHCPARTARAQEAVLAADYGAAPGPPVTDDIPPYARTDPEVVRHELARIRAGPWARRIVVDPSGLESCPERFVGPDVLPFRRRPCTAVHREAFIYPSGDVSACANAPTLVVGNVRHDGIRDVWNGPAWRRFRCRVGVPGGLPRCGYCTR